MAGDIFDSSNPSAASQRLLYQFVREAKRRLPKLGIVLIAGNHDSPSRLEAPSPLLEVLGVTVVGQLYRPEGGVVDAERFLVPLLDRDGEPAAWCLAVPFLRPGDLPRVETEGDAYLAGVELVYRQGLDLALSRHQRGQAVVALGHCHLAGGQTSEDSERRLVVGGAEALSTSVFGTNFAYVALGHLHRPQAVAGHDRLRYSGSPLPMSFAEIDYPHQVVRVDLEGEQAVGIEPILVPRAVELLRVPTIPAPVEAALAELASLALPEVPQERRPFLQVRVALDAPEPRLRVRVEAALQGAPIRLAKIETTLPHRDALAVRAAPISLDDLGRFGPEEVFRRLHADLVGGEPPQELLTAFAELLNESGEPAQ